MNKQNLIYLCLTFFFVLACGIFGNSKIAVKSGNFSTEMEEKSSAVFIRNQFSEAEFIIANYKLDLNEKSVQSMEKLNSPQQVRVAFAVKGEKADFVERGKPLNFEGGQIKWVDIYFFEDGQEKVVNLKNVQGNIRIATVRENDVIGGIFIYGGNSSVRGTFTSKIIY